MQGLRRGSGRTDWQAHWYSQIERGQQAQVLDYMCSSSCLLLKNPCNAMVPSRDMPRPHNARYFCMLASPRFLSVANITALLDCFRAHEDDDDLQAYVRPCCLCIQLLYASCHHVPKVVFGHDCAVNDGVQAQRY